MRSNITNFAVLAVALTFVGGATVSAEEALVQIPFESHGMNCTFNELAIEYMCTWQGLKPVFTIEDLKEYQSVMSEERYNEEVEKLNEAAMAEIMIEQAKLTPNELMIEKIEDKLDHGVATAQDSVYMNLLKTLETCEQGQGRTAAIQAERIFEVASFDKWQYNNISYSGAVGVLVLAIEECTAQKEVYKLSVGYQNFLTGDDDVQYSLAHTYTPDVQALNFADHTATHTNVNQALICDNNQFADTHKKQFGCEVLYDGKTVEQIEYENEVRFGTDGLISYQSDALDNYHEFMTSYGNIQATIEDKKVQELIAVPISNEWKESNNFYQNQLKNGD